VLNIDGIQKEQKILPIVQNYHPQPCISSAANTECNWGIPLTLAKWPPEGSANNRGYPANLSGPRVEAHTLKLAADALITLGVGSGGDGTEKYQTIKSTLLTRLWCLLRYCCCEYRVSPANSDDGVLAPGRASHHLNWPWAPIGFMNQRGSFSWSC